MTRSFYASALLFTGLYLLIALYRSILHLQLGLRVGELPSLAGWSSFEFVVWFVWSLLLLKYFHARQYWFTAGALVASLAAALVQFILLYKLLKTRELSDYYVLSAFLASATGALYGVSLLVSAAGRRTWLKAAGGLLLCCEGVMLFSLGWAMRSHEVLLNGTQTYIGQWTALLASLGPALFMMNFWAERATAAKANPSSGESWDAAIHAAAGVALVATLFFGPRLAVETMRIIGDPDQVPQYLRQAAEPYEARTYVNGRGDTLRYRLMKPLGYDSTQHYPLVVCLHGSSGCGRDNVKQVVASLPAQWLSAPENRSKYAAFLLVPQCPLQMSWGGIDGLPAVDSLVVEALLALEQEVKIAKNRRYVAGNSLGGYGVWHLIGTRPELFAAALPISGGGDPALGQRIAGVPLWAFHGAKDRNVPVSGSRDVIEAVKRAGGTPRYTEYPDLAHHIGPQVATTPGLFDWLFAQKRE
ncbi:MAG: peptidase [Cytophagales bacterium]|nr:peptidase [Cytophagales bacterium]